MYSTRLITKTYVDALFSEFNNALIDINKTRGEFAEAKPFDRRQIVVGPVRESINLKTFAVVEVNGVYSFDGQNALVTETQIRTSFYLSSNMKNSYELAQAYQQAMGYVTKALLDRRINLGPTLLAGNGVGAIDIARVGDDNNYYGFQSEYFLRGAF